MKSSESLESRLTGFLLESAVKLADLISADVFVLIDSSATPSTSSPSSSFPNDNFEDVELSVDDHVENRNCRNRRRLSNGARIWSSGASSLRSAFLREGLRVRESDVEFAVKTTTGTPSLPTVSAEFGCVGANGKSPTGRMEGRLILGA